MSDFKYETDKPIVSKRTISTDEMTIKSVRFMVPVMIEVELDGVTHTLQDSSIDYVNRKVYIGNKPAGQKLADKIFAFVTPPVPDYQYQASDEVYEQASKAHEEFRELYKENVGETDV